MVTHCKTHNQILTNFCSSQTSMVPLCPSCIGEHSTYHERVCSRSQITTVKEIFMQTDVEKKTTADQLNKNLSSLRKMLDQVNQTPNHIKKMVAEIRRNSILNLETLFGKLESALLKQNGKQTYKPCSQISKSIRTIEGFLSQIQVMVPGDVEALIKFQKGDKGKNIDEIARGLIKAGESDRLTGLGMSKLDVNKDAQQYLKEFVNNCIMSNKNNKSCTLPFTSKNSQSERKQNMYNISQSVSVVDKECTISPDSIVNKLREQFGIPNVVFTELSLKRKGSENEQNSSTVCSTAGFGGFLHFQK